jgi:hypothetical protein
MKKGYSVESIAFTSKVNFIYLFNFSLINKIANYGFLNNFDKLYNNREQCVGVWKIKKLN